jgi:thioredoxin 1
VAENGIVEVTAENFQAVVLESETPVLVDFWAEWCGPCRMIAPVLEQIAKEREGEILIGKLNVDDHSELAVRYGVQSIPFLGLFEHGQLARRAIGAMPKAQLEMALGLS